MLSMNCTVHVNMFTFYRWLSMRGNSFLVCSACDEIGSAYAQHAIKSFPRMLSVRMLYFSKMTQKSLTEMQISPIKNPNFEKPSGNLSNRTKVKILKKKFCWISLKKIWFRVCSVTAEMFEHRNSGENQRKRSEFFFENSRRAYKDLI
jgi:hypothetical protein